MDDDLERDLTIIEGTWGSEENLYDFLEQQVRELCPLICGLVPPVPVVQVKPSWLARGLFGGHHAAADYEPEERDQPARISVFPSILHDRALVRVAITHELIHHWEHLESDVDELFYPAEADKIIAEKYSDPARERTWRSGHSRRFIAKAANIADELKLSLRDILFR